MKVLIAIPARYASERYPGKPLVTLRGAQGSAKSLIERTWLAAKGVSQIARTIVATDDERIRDTVLDFGGEVVMTSSACQNGTERCAEALEALGGGFDIVVNLQGDAPLTPPWFIEGLIAALRADASAEIATPVLQCSGAMLSSLLQDRRAGRIGGTTAVFGANRKALYFSKEVLPFTGRSYAKDEPTPVFHHVGVYAYRAAALRAYPRWCVGPLERVEGLEQLRFLENGHAILCTEVAARGRQFWELNNPGDVAKIEAMMAAMGMQ
jgi:3-deoxy-manno-octulosonate cytidylyltransferase (CMP-KDO synthetase)